MPSLPVSVGKVMEICNNPDVSPSDLNHVISLDPVLTGRILHLINSAYYGLGTHVTSLIKAITMLGINTVKNLALSTAILSTLPEYKEINGIDMEGFWRHCLCVGVTAKLLAVKQGIDGKYQQEYFTAGLLHDIGKIPLNAVFSSNYVNAVTLADRSRRPLYQIEGETLGITHCAAGAAIAGAWKLDSPLADVIAWHHDSGSYTGENARLLSSIVAADYFSIAYEVGFSGNRSPSKPDVKIWETIGVKEDYFEGLKEKVFLEIDKAKVFLKIK